MQFQSLEMLETETHIFSRNSADRVDCRRFRFGGLRKAQGGTNDAK